MDRLAITSTLFGLVFLVGCGSSAPPETQVAQTQTPVNQPTAVSAPASTPPSPTDVVSQFLDEIRRGGEDSSANDLLTQRAQSELKRIGRQVQPIGSPDAKFVVTRAESVPGEDNSALVHSIWSEPNGDGTNSDYQVVWAMAKENVGWRISGLAMELQADQAPVIIDFENGELMAKLLATPEQPGTGSSAQTANTGQSISR